MRIMIDAGKAVYWHAPVRPGDELTANSQLHDIYEKTGRGGTMLFLVHRMEFRNAAADLVAVVDWRLILRGGLEGQA
jgi:3-methylfumaryl-CoA hydratase